MKEIKVSKLSRDKKEYMEMWALVDDEDYIRLSKYNWSIKQRKLKSSPDIFYAQTGIKKNGKQVVESMHRMIMNPKKDMQVDHCDHNGLHNYKENLRICTRAENSRHRRISKNKLHSQYKGVTWDNRVKKWISHIRYNSKNLFLGYFTNEKLAAYMYDAASSLIHKEYSITNFNKIIPKYLKLVNTIIHNSAIVKTQTSKYLGVSYYKRTAKWKSRISLHNKRIHIGYFDTEHQAAIAYNTRAKELLGTKAKLNIVEEV